jgi:hypothetical protein
MTIGVLQRDETDQRKIVFTINQLCEHENAVSAGVGVASLPAPSTTNRGSLAFVIDSTTNVWGAIAAGGGANAVLLMSNGTNWTVIGK